MNFWCPTNLPHSLYSAVDYILKIYNYTSWQKAKRHHSHSPHYIIDKSHRRQGEKKLNQRKYLWYTAKKAQEERGKWARSSDLRGQRGQSCAFVLSPYSWADSQSKTNCLNTEARCRSAPSSLSHHCTQNNSSRDNKQQTHRLDPDRQHTLSPRTRQNHCL